MVRRSAQNRFVGNLPLVLLTSLLVIMLIPLLLVTINSFKTEAEYYATGPFGLPQSFSLDVLQTTWARTGYTMKLINSTIISVATALLATALSFLNAYALGIGRVRARSWIIIFFLLAITLPAEALVYPLYYFFNQIGLYNTRLAVILVTAALHTAFGTYLLTSVLSSFNRELIEAAVLDGCNKLQLLLRIIVPLTAPTLSVLFVFFFIWTWNDFFLPLIFLISNEKQTVPVAMALARGERGMVITMQSAAGLLGLVPPLIFFFLFQRTLTRGILAGGSK